MSFLWEQRLRNAAGKGIRPIFSALEDTEKDEYTLSLSLSLSLSLFSLSLSLSLSLSFSSNQQSAVQH